MPGPRDSQRARVYRAELPLASSPLPGLEACARFADRVVGTLWWQARFPDLTLDRLPPLRPGHGAKTAYFRDCGGDLSITLPRRYRTKGIVLHELAHWALHVDASDLPSHGPTFVRVLLDANTEFCGPERAEALAAAYQAERVRVGEPPRHGPDGRWHYGCDERLRLGRGRALTLHVGGAPGPVRGVLERVESRGATLVLREGSRTHRVPCPSVWLVEPAR